MIKILNQLVLRYPSLKQFVKFSSVGVANTVIDFSIFFTLTSLFYWWYSHYLFSNFVAFFCANIFSFLVNKRWTFSSLTNNYASQYTKFLLVSVISLITVQIAMYFLVDIKDTTYLFAKIFALFISIIINFTGSKFWAFK